MKKLTVNRQELSMDIDLVVFWEDYTDIDYIRLNSVYQRNKDSGQQDLYGNRVFKDREILRYFLRSVEKHLKFIRNIFIITNYELPSWINFCNSRIKPLSYRTIIPFNVLPIFNYSVIERFVVNIPNLAERFLYVSENAFFVKDIKRSFFFNEKGYPYIRFKSFFPFQKELEDKENIAIKNAIELSQKYLGKKPQFFKHCNIEAFYKPDIIKCLEKIDKEIKNTIYNKFPTEDDVSRYIWTYHAYYNNHAEYRYPNFYQLSNIVKLFVQYFYKLIKDTQEIKLSQKNYMVLSKTRMISFEKDFDAEEQDEIRAIDFLQQKFPEKSCYEV
jgi:hypothetical protein